MTTQQHGPGTVTVCDLCHRALEVIAWPFDAIPELSVATPGLLAQHARRCRFRAYTPRACRIAHHEIGGPDDRDRRG